MWKDDRNAISMATGSISVPYKCACISDKETKAKPEMKNDFASVSLR